MLAIPILVSCAQQTPNPDFSLRIAGVGPLDALQPTLDNGYSMLVKGLVFPPFLLPQWDGGWRSPAFSAWERTARNHYRFKLDANVHFSDGALVRMEDVLASLAAFRLRGVERDGWIEVEPVDSATSVEPILLRAVLFKEGTAGPLGTGPFSVATQSVDRIELRRASPANGRIAKVELLAFPSPREEFARALLGDVNALMILDPSQIELFQGVPRFQIVTAPGIQVIAAVFNSRTLSRGERKTLAHALPVEEIGRAHAGDCEVFRQPQSAIPLPLGRTLSLVAVETDSAVRRAALALRRSLGTRGGTLKIDEGRSPVERLLESDLFDIMVTPMRTWPPGQAALRWRTGAPMNFAGYSNPALDRALDAGDYDQAERELESDPPAVLICRRQRIAAIDARVKNPRIGPYDLFQSLPEWDLAP